MNYLNAIKAVSKKVKTLMNLKSIGQNNELVVLYKYYNGTIWYISGH